MGREVKREEIDYSIFVAEAEYYLAQIRGGCPGGDVEALERTIRNYGGSVTEDDVREWARDPDFRRVLKHARELGDDARRWDEQQAQRDAAPLATPPRPGAPDPYAIPPGGDVHSTLANVTTPRRGLLEWLRSWGRAADIARNQETPDPKPHFILESEMTDADWRQVAIQNASSVHRDQRVPR